MKRLDRIGVLIIVFWLVFGVYYFQPNVSSFLETSGHEIETQHFMISADSGDIGYLNRRYLRDSDSLLIEESAGAIIRFEGHQCFIRSTVSINLTEDGRVKSFQTQVDGLTGQRLLKGRYSPKQKKFKLTDTDGSTSTSELKQPPHLVYTLFQEREPSAKSFSARLLDPYRAYLATSDITHVKEDTVDIFGDKRESRRYRFQPKSRSIDFQVGTGGDILLRRLGEETVMIAVGRDLGRANKSKINREGRGLPESSCRAPERATQIYQRMLGNRLVTSLKNNTSGNDE